MYTRSLCDIFTCLEFGDARDDADDGEEGDLRGQPGDREDLPGIRDSTRKVYIVLQ